MPVQSFLCGEMAIDASAEVEFRAAGVDVTAGGKVEGPQATDGDSDRPRDEDSQLIRLWADRRQRVRLVAS